jgi:hypothetical protein
MSEVLTVARAGDGLDTPADRQETGVAGEGARQADGKQPTSRFQAWRSTVGAGLNLGLSERRR